MKVLRNVLLLAVLLGGAWLVCQGPRLARWAVPADKDAVPEELFEISADYARRLEGVPTDSPEAWRLRAERARKLDEARRRLGLRTQP
jgi:hypothetical protein